MSHVTRMNEKFHTYEGIISRIWMSHVTRMNQLWHATHTATDTATHAATRTATHTATLIATNQLCHVSQML